MTGVVLAVGAESVKRVELELGGKSAKSSTTQYASPTPLTTAR